MLELERCIHQGRDVGHHALFKEQWERCKNCTYDLENNKRCPGYSPTSYYNSLFGNFNLKDIQKISEDVRA
jgi:hypothetical protein